MIDDLPFPELTRALAEDPAFVIELTGRLKARTVDLAVVERLVAFARARQATVAHAMARHALTAAGISWEAL